MKSLSRNQCVAYSKKKQPPWVLHVDVVLESVMAISKKQQITQIWWHQNHNTIDYIKYFDWNLYLGTWNFLGSLPTARWSLEFMESVNQTRTRSQYVKVYGFQLESRTEPNIWRDKKQAVFQLTAAGFLDFYRDVADSVYVCVCCQHIIIT